jgi:intracellular septation protein A
VGLVNGIIFAPFDCNAFIKWQKFILFHIFFLHLTGDIVAIVRTIGFMIGRIVRVASALNYHV